MLLAVEEEVLDRGGVPSSFSGVTRGLAEDTFASFVPGDLIELHPRSIYYAIVRGARAGKSPAAIAAELRSAYARGAL